MRWARTLVAMLAVAGCKPIASDVVEVQLFPCLLEGMEPRSVRVEIVQFDADQNPIGDPLEGAFTVPDTAFSDGFATLGYKPALEAVLIDATVHWYMMAPAGPAEDADESLLYSRVEVPDLGESIELGAQNCRENGSSGGTVGGEDSSSTAMPPTTTLGLTDTGPDTTTGVSETTAMSDTMSDASSSGTDSDDTTGGFMSMEGEGCDTTVDSFYCEPQPDGGGKLLLCMGEMWLQNPGICQSDVCGATLPSHPNWIGCAGEGPVEWSCLCQADAPPNCAAEPPGCAGTSDLTLCVDGSAAAALCVSNNCSYANPTNYTCF